MSEKLECKKCGNKFSYEHGVFDVVSPKLSSNQEILWEITDDMIENDIEATKQKDNDNACIKDYNVHKNKETLEAEKMLSEHMDSLIEGFSGIVCDLSTGMGCMLQKMLNANNKNFSIVCTDIDKRILMWTRKLKQTDDHRVFYIASDGKYMSIKDKSFDYIASLAVFGNIPENDKVAKELYRILKPNGKIVIQGNYIEKDSKSFELAQSKSLERGLVEEYLVNDLKNAGFENIISTVVAEVVWAENPYDLLPVAGDTQRYCIIQAQRTK
ncbi:class I SAM-dependent methyltransferase [Clostridium sp. CM027]|uniref:class I SAM-dependent methyltransferase n=1 Tax=Clostridium sp. CM027 TaxID=2849865 RepID=UPI00215A88AA|nr:class I SAM-dependent methyltransferase [Clostridium sp. CM027]UVE42076.1 class I SAM-dependent methyltransferase [Clostridium sp. CM027]